ncbi:unnamed protein product [Dracunculus medinensis]|uniref:Galectin n=1 Tax=Dracunculus medinensis TaxID=318479 RepID=A0A0N4UFF7_DRAME|nr:unnamed protein product [Dracunculus medinensis]
MSEQKSYPIPYRSQLQEKIEPGQTLIVKGSTIDESQRFTLNLHCKTADFSGNDVPLHMSIRFDEGKIVLNTFSNGEWGKEERKSNPFKRGEAFDIRIRAHDDRFQISCDQKEFKNYEHRLPLSSITHLSVDGDLYLNQVHWGGKYYAKRFLINLLKKNGDIALHFNPRFDEKVVVRNALQSNEWGNEEKEGKMPFEKGVGFDLSIKNEEYAFQIFVNDVRFASFAHRSDPHDISGLQIQGDLELTGIQIH